MGKGRDFAERACEPISIIKNEQDPSYGVENVGFLKKPLLSKTSPGFYMSSV